MIEQYVLAIVVIEALQLAVQVWALTHHRRPKSPHGPVR